MDLASRDSYIQKLASKVVSQREQEPKKKPFGNVSPSVLISSYDIKSWQLCFGFVNACWNALFIVCRVSYSHVNTHYCYSPKMALRCLWSSCWCKSIVWHFKLPSLCWYFYHPDYLFVVLYVQSHLCSCNSPARSLNVFKCIILIAAMTSETVEFDLCVLFFVCFQLILKGRMQTVLQKRRKSPKSGILKRMTRVWSHLLLKHSNKNLQHQRSKQRKHQQNRPALELKVSMDHHCRLRKVINSCGVWMVCCPFFWTHSTGDIC